MNAAPNDGKVPSSERDQSMAQLGLSQVVAYFLRLSAVGFGGPITLVEHMQKDLVEDRHWFSQQDYLQGFAFFQLSPGPLAAQLGIYLGWLHSGIVGAFAGRYGLYSSVVPDGHRSGGALRPLRRAFVDLRRVLWDRRRCCGDHRVECL